MQYSGKANYKRGPKKKKLKAEHSLLLQTPWVLFSYFPCHYCTIVGRRLLKSFAKNFTKTIGSEVSPSHENDSRHYFG